MNRKTLKRIITILTLAILIMSIAIPVFAATQDAGAAAGAAIAAETEGEIIADTQATSNTTSGKAMAAAIAIGLAACGGAVAMGMAVSKSAEGISRQPEAEGKIRTTLMLGLVFIETAIIYALLVVILIIFVL